MLPGVSSTTNVKFSNLGPELLAVLRTKLYNPGLTVFKLDTVKTELPIGVTGLTLNAAVAGAGKPVMLIATGSV